MQHFPYCLKKKATYNIDKFHKVQPPLKLLTSKLVYNFVGQLANSIVDYRTTYCNTWYNLERQGADYRQYCYDKTKTNLLLLNF